MPHASLSSAPVHASRFRWVICGLLFLATVINYLDRSVLGVLAGTLQKEIGWTDTQYGDINAAFQLAYGLGFVALGWLVDRTGTRIGYAISLVFWSIAAAAHALARSAFGFGVARFFLGLGEAGNFPCAIKAVAEWFPRKERALATGIFISGTTVGAVLAPLVVPWLTLRWGWQSAFAVTGIAGLAWVAIWWPLYRRPQDHPRVSAGELAHIESDPDEGVSRVKWCSLLPHRRTWAIALVKFLTDPIWWFYLFWAGKFLQDKFGVDLKHLGAPLVCIYLLADVGSIAGGWFSSSLIKRGWATHAARKAAMLACAVCVLPVVYVPITSSQWTAVLLLGLAAACHQGFAANVFTLASDIFPRRAVGSVVGISGMAGGLGGFLFQLGVGRVKDLTGSYIVPFAIAGTIYLVSVLAMHLLCPKGERVAVN
jgi:MFS transporter, ACS family, hexuronate transporter